MKTKPFFIKIFKILLLIFLILIFFFLYFLPSIEKINGQKRRLIDMNFKIKNYVSIEHDFSFPDKTERALFRKTDNDLKQKMPEISNNKRLKELDLAIFSHIKNRARENGIFNLILTTNDSKEPEFNFLESFSNKKILDRLKQFTGIRINEIKKSKANLFPPPFKNLSNISFILSFTGDIKNAAGFLNQLPWADMFLKLEDVIVYSDVSNPIYMVGLRVYFIDSKINTTKEEELTIDFDSPLLLKRVYLNPVKRSQKTKLRKEFGSNIFYRELGEKSPLIKNEEEIRFQLHSLVTKKEKKTAIINEIIVRVGDFVTGAEVIRIDKSGVHLKYNQENFSLSHRQRTRIIKPKGNF